MRVAASSSAGPSVGPVSIGAKPCTASAWVMPSHETLGSGPSVYSAGQLRMTRRRLGDRRRR